MILQTKWEMEKVLGIFFDLQGLNFLISPINILLRVWFRN